MPLHTAAMPCSRTPNESTFRPGWQIKVGEHFSSVLLEGERSAEPPTSSGMAAASALSTFPEELRVAIAPSAGVNLGRASLHPAGNSPRNRRSSSEALAGNEVRYASNADCHAAKAPSPFSLVDWKWLATSSGTGIFVGVDTKRLFYSRNIIVAEGRAVDFV